MSLPDFFIAGVPKAGSTALHVALDRHPQLFLSRNKEPKHFLTDGPPPTGGGPGDAKTYRGYVWRREEYEALFDEAPPGALKGESTPFYLFDREAQKRIRAAIPHARLVVLVRDPIDRAHSNWTHLWSAGLEPESDFLAACALERRRAAAGWAAFWRYLELGRYGEQLEHLYTVFPREQVLLVRYRDLREAPVAALDRVCAFLGVRTGVLTEVPAANVTTHSRDSPRNRAVAALVRAGTAVEHRLPCTWWPKISDALGRHLQSEQRLRQPLTAEQRERLIPHFVEDVRLLERLTGESFADWLDPHKSFQRSALKVNGRIGTAYTSIDRPFAGAERTSPATAERGTP